LCDEIKENNTVKKIKNSRSTLSYLKGESEKEHSVRILENQLDKSKLNKLYADKLSLLLYDSPKYKNYPIKRKNIDNIEFKYNENNELRLTLRKYQKKEFPQINPNIQSQDNKSNKCYDSYRNIDFINDDNYNSNKLLTPNRNELLIEEEKIYNKGNFLRLNDEVKNILFNSDDQIPISKQKEIYEKLKKQFSHYKQILNSQLYLPLLNSERPNKMAKCQKFFSKTPKTPKANNNFRQKLNYYNIEQILKTANELGNLMNKNDTNKKLTYKDNLLGQINKEPSAGKSIIRIKKKIILPSYEMFNYNSKKWKQQEISKKNNNSNINFVEIDKKINDKINEMKNKVIVLNQEIFKLEEVRNKMKSQKKLKAVKSNSFRNFKSLFSNKLEQIKATKKLSKYNLDYE
jgi:hypothetical protein